MGSSFVLINYTPYNERNKQEVIPMDIIMGILALILVAAWLVSLGVHAVYERVRQMFNW